MIDERLGDGLIKECLKYLYLERRLQGDVCEEVRREIEGEMSRCVKCVHARLVLDRIMSGERLNKRLRKEVENECEKMIEDVMRRD